jgi:predicted acylesterase/phospholipase RssA
VTNPIRPQPGKLALVLAGGGLLGAVYEIGALRAIDDLLVDRTVNDFDLYIGTSAGAIVASLLASGLSPEQMFQGIAGANPELQPIERGHLFNLNHRDLLRSGLSLPRSLAEEGIYHLHHLRELTLLDLAWSAAQVLPSGVYTSAALEKYMQTLLVASGGSDSFDDLRRELFVIATELDTGERAIFSTGADCRVPISTAVAASSAMPLIYRPVRICGADYVDGGLRGNASIDLAIEHGATLVVCINSMVPYRPGPGKHLKGPSRREVNARGIGAVASQTLRILAHGGLRYHIKQLARVHPEVDIIVIEPRADDEQMFYGNAMHYPDRLEVARHGFETVTLELAEDYNHYKQVLARHGIPLTRRLVVGELEEIRKSGHDPKVINRVLEAKSAACNRARRHTPFCELNRALAVLELELDLRSPSTG